LVDPVGEDLVARALVGREPLDQRVERALGVEHHRPQLALHGHAVAREARRLDQDGVVAELAEPERGGEPARRIDGHHGDPQPALGHAQPERRGGRRLADAAGAGAHDDPLVLQERCQHENISRRAIGTG
jgi:hypothetical protein